MTQLKELGNIKQMHVYGFLFDTFHGYWKAYLIQLKTKNKKHQKQKNEKTPKATISQVF